MLRLALLVVFARMLTPTDYGVFALGVAVVSLMEIFTRMGVEPALIQRCAISRTDLASSGLFCLFSACLGTAAIIMFAGDLANLLGGSDELANVIRGLALGLPLGALAVVPRAMLSRTSRFKELALAELFGYGLSAVCVALPLALAGAGVWALVLSALAQSAFTLVLLTRYESPFHGLGVDRHALAAALKFGKPLAGAQASNFVALQADNIIVGVVLGAASLGAYTRAYALNSMPATLLGQAMSRTLLPAMSELQSDRDGLARAVLRGQVALMAIFAPVSAFCVYHADGIIGIALGAQWSAAIPAFQILSLGMYFRLAYKLPDTALLAIGRPDINLRVHIVYAVLIVLGSWVGVQFGLPGVSTAVVCAIVLQYFQVLTISARELGFSWHALLRDHILSGLLGLTTYILLNLNDAILSMALLPSATIRLGAGAVVLTLVLGCVYLGMGCLYGERGLWWRERSDGLLIRRQDPV